MLMQEKEVWVEEDKMEEEEFDISKYFTLHDMDRDGEWNRQVRYAPPPTLLPTQSISRSITIFHVQFQEQRWSLTLANRSNARQRSNIRAPPPPRYIYPKCGNL